MCFAEFNRKPELLKMIFSNFSVDAVSAQSHIESPLMGYSKEHVWKNGRL